MTVSNRPRGIVWALALWGDEHTRLFLDYHLPTIMHPSNLPAMKEVAPIRAFIYTRPETLEAIREPLRRAATDYGFSVEAKIIDDPARYPHGSFAMSRAQWDVARIVSERNEALVFSYPDTIVAADSYGHVAAKAKEGHRAVLWQGPTMREEAAEPFAAPGSAWAEVPYRDLLAATTNGLHPLTASRLWPGAIGWPSIMHHFDAGALCMRTWHPNPLYIWPRHYPAGAWQDSLDGTYIGKSGLAWDECVRLTEPSFFWSEVAPDSKRERQGTPQSWDDASLKAWAIRNGIPDWNQREFGLTYRFEAPA